MEFFHKISNLLFDYLVRNIFYYYKTLQRNILTFYVAPNAGNFAEIAKSDPFILLGKPN